MSKVGKIPGDICDLIGTIITPAHCCKIAYCCRIDYAHLTGICNRLKHALRAVVDILFLNPTAEPKGEGTIYHYSPKSACFNSYHKATSA